MAWYDITYACGHTGREQLYGKNEERERRLRYLEGCMCPECEKKNVARRVEEQRITDSAAGLPDLTGSDKQIAWARQLRKSFLEEWESFCNHVEKQKNSFSSDHSPEEVEAEYKIAVKTLALAKEQTIAHTSAYWWINNRSGCLEKAIVEAEKMIRANPNDDTPVAIDAKAEATVTPENKTKTVIPEIAVTEEEVILKSPRDEDLRNLVRELGYKFSDGAWRREITIFTGSALDRAAELGNTLLRNGFSVIIYDGHVRDMAIRGEFAQECQKWVSCSTTGQCSGWLCIKFPRGRQDLYDAARMIKGSRWDSPNVVVPIQYFDQVLDMAEMLGYSITPGANKASFSYKLGLRGSVVPDEPEKPAEINKLGEIMDTSADVISDLADD